MKKVQPEPKYNDIGHVGWVILTILTVGLLLGPMISSLRAQPLTHYEVGACFDRGFDTWTIDTVFFVIFDGSSGAVDSGLVSVIDTARYAGRNDTLCFKASVLSSQISALRNPWGMFVVDIDYGGGTIKRVHEVVDISHMIHSVDTARYSFATAVVDYDSIYNMMILACSGGTGVYSDSIKIIRRSDSTGLGAGVVVRLKPNGGGNSLQMLTDANGWAKFSVDVDTFFVHVWTPDYQQEISPDTNKSPGGNVKDTVWMAASVGAGSISPALTPVSFVFYTSSGTAIKEVVLTYELEPLGGTDLHHLDSTKNIVPKKKGQARTDANGKALIYVVPNDSIVVSGNQVGTTRYRIMAKDPSTGFPLLGETGILLNVTASATEKRYPMDFIR